MSETKADDASYTPKWVTLAIGVAVLIILLCVAFGEGLGLAGTTAPAPLFPDADKIIVDKHLVFVAIPLLLLSLGCAVLWPGKKGFRYFCNTFSFLQVTTYCFLWTAHSGGLSSSIYGAAYLSLFPVALIIPRTIRIKVLTTVPVAFFAVWMALAIKPPNQGREIFICLTSMTGAFLGVVIRWFLIRAMRPASD